MWKREVPHQYVPLNYLTLKTHDSGRLTTRRAHWMYPDARTTALLERRMLCGSSELPWKCGRELLLASTCFDHFHLHRPPTMFFKWFCHDAYIQSQSTWFCLTFWFIVVCMLYFTPADPHCFHLLVHRNWIGLQLWRAMRCWESTRRWRREWRNAWFDWELQMDKWISHFISQCFYLPLSPDFLTNIFVQRYSWNPSVFYHQRWLLY